jgi:predicted nucleic acid-binding protein
MRRLFADASYYVAFLYSRDGHHREARALAATSSNERVGLVPSEAVFIEVLAFFSRFEAELKRRVADFMEALIADDSVTIVPLTGALLGRAVALYKSRADQPYSLTDCATMEVCRELGIKEILTADQDSSARVSLSC